MKNDIIYQSWFYYEYKQNKYTRLSDIPYPSNKLRRIHIIDIRIIYKLTNKHHNKDYGILIKKWRNIKY